MLSKLKCRGFRATSLSTYDFSTLYTTLPHNLIKEKLLDLIEWTFKRALKTMIHFIWPVMTEKLFSLPLTKVDIHFGHVRMYCDALSCLLDNIYIRFGSKSYRPPSPPPPPPIKIKWSLPYCVVDGPKCPMSCRLIAVWLYSERNVPFAKGRFSHERKILFQNFELIDYNCACFKRFKR